MLKNGKAHSTKLNIRVLIIWISQNESFSDTISQGLLIAKLEANRFSQSAPSYMLSY